MCQDAGRLLYVGQDDWVHVNCALWSAEVYEEEHDGTLQNVQTALSRGRVMVRVDSRKMGLLFIPYFIYKLLIKTFLHIFQFVGGIKCNQLFQRQFKWTFGALILSDDRFLLCWIYLKYSIYLLWWASYYID